MDCMSLSLALIKRVSHQRRLSLDADNGVTRLTDVDWTYSCQEA
jgi:hypothetical protein